jgi:exportin-1
MQALHYLLLVSEVDDIEVFKVCLEYWTFLASSLFNEE